MSLEQWTWSAAFVCRDYQKSIKSKIYFMSSLPILIQASITWSITYLIVPEVTVNQQGLQEESERQMRLLHNLCPALFENPDSTVMGVFETDFKLMHIHLLSFFVTLSSIEAPILAIYVAQCLTQLLAVTQLGTVTELSKCARVIAMTLLRMASA